MKKIMVCVTQQKQCDRLIHRAYSLKKDDDDEIYVIHIVKENWKYFGKLKEADALEFLFEKAKEYGAELNVFKAKDIEGKLASFAVKNNIDIVIMGESREHNTQQNMIKRLKGKVDKDLEFDIVSSEYKI